MEKQTDNIFLYQNDLVSSTFVGIKVAEGTAEHSLLSSIYTTDQDTGFSGTGTPFFQPSYPSGAAKCSCCQVLFNGRESQIEHYSNDWHQYNIKRSLNGLSPLSSEKYETFKQNECENSDERSEESSDGDADMEKDGKLQYKRSPYIFFENVDEKILAIYRTVLLPKKSHPESLEELISRGNSCHKKLYWTIILVSGGNFAGAVFKGETVVTHKAFHSYTVRAKQGGSQSSHDNEKSHAKSLGASLRRYNERSFAEHVQEILNEWNEHIENSDLIFYHCPMHNHKTLFSGSNPVLQKGDFRLRTIPFPTKKPNYSEVKRIHDQLSQVIIYDKEEFEKLSMENVKQVEKPILKRAKEKKKEFTNILLQSEIESDSEPEDVELSYSMQEINFRNLEQYGHFIPDKRKEIKTKSDNSNLYLKNRIKTMAYMACQSGNVKMLKALRMASDSSENKEYEELLGCGIYEYMQKEKQAFDINFKSGRSEKTLLHIASENSRNDTILWLLEEGCDPTVPDISMKVPYSFANKTSKLIFRRFMADNPDKYNYKKAGVSSPLSKEEYDKQKDLELEKKKQQKVVKKAKQKENKKIIQEAKKMEEEKQRFLELSDREKRALAAEMRIMSTGGGAIKRQRCFQCGQDITGEIPFEYSSNKFCSTNCVKEHRKSNR